MPLTRVSKRTKKTNGQAGWLKPREWNLVNTLSGEPTADRQTSNWAPVSANSKRPPCGLASPSSLQTTAGTPNNPTQPNCLPEHVRRGNSREPAHPVGSGVSFGTSCEEGSREGRFEPVHLPPNKFVIANPNR